jgi:hypothetical protein
MALHAPLAASGPAVRPRRLGHMLAQRVHQGGPLTDEQVSRLERHRGCLLLGTLHRNRAHRRPLGRHDDRLGIGSVVLLPLYRSNIASTMRMSAVGPGRFSSRDMAGCEQSSVPVSGKRPTAILNAGSSRKASQSLASA